MMPVYSLSMLRICAVLRIGLQCLRALTVGGQPSIPWVGLHRRAATWKEDDSAVKVVCGRKEAVAGEEERVREIAGRQNVAYSVVECSALVDRRGRPGVESGPSGARRQAFARLSD